MACLFMRFRKVVLRDRFLHDTEKVCIFMNFRVFSKKFKDVVENFVLKRWAKRCGTQKCVDEWNATIGKVSGMKASL